MFCKIKTFIGKLNISDKIIFFVLLILAVGALIPVYRLALYSCPYYDDYSYSFYVRNFFELEGFAGIIKGIYHTVKGFWISWQGTYASTTAMSLAGVAFGEQYYFISIWIVLTVISLGAFSLVYTLTSKILKASGYNAGSFAIMVTVLLLEYIYSSYQGIFWYNAAVHYTFMHGIMFFMLAATVSLVYSERVYAKVLWMLLTIILAISSAGANFVTCLQGLLFLILIFVASAIWKRKNCLYLIPSIIAYIIGFYKNVSAPGNNVRSSFFEGEGPCEAILNSLVEALKRIPELTTLPSLILIAAMIPLMICVVRKSTICFSMPGVVTVLAYGIYATGYTSSFYAMGAAPIERTMVCVKFTYQILLIITLTYWIGWAYKKFANGEFEVKHNIVFYLVVFVMMNLCLFLSNTMVNGFLTYGSYYYVHDCEAQNFRAEYLNRIDIIKNSDSGRVGVPAHIYHPWFLTGMNELSTDETAEQNSFMARYYGVDAIYIDENYSK